MLRVKYKMHRLINILFYGLVFIIGFLLGGGKIENFKEIFYNWFI